jgi:hypothetical protein
MPQGAPTTAAQPGGDTTQHEAVFVCHQGECPAWKEADDPARQQAPAPATQAAAFAPRASLLHDTSPDASDEVRRRVAQLNRADLIERYRTAYVDGKRLTAYVMAGELIERGIPPCFWHEVLALDDTTLAQREVLALADLA